MLWDKNNNNMKQVSGWMKGENELICVEGFISFHVNWSRSVSMKVTVGGQISGLHRRRVMAH